MDFAAARKVMVDSQVRVNDVTDSALQAALLETPRERFLPADRAFSAYAEIQPEIANGRLLMLARDLSKLLMALGAKPGERALAIAGVISIVLGGMILAQWPYSGIYILGLFLAINLIFEGISWITVGLSAKA